MASAKMESRIRYDICPACGYQNPERIGECPACNNRLFSDGEEEHQRYVRLITAEHRKRSLQLWFGWPVVFIILLGPLAFGLKGIVPVVPGAAMLVGAMVLGWKLIDLRKKHTASALFL